MHFTLDIQVPMNPFSAKNYKTNYNVVAYRDHGTKRVNYDQLNYGVTMAQLVRRWTPDHKINGSTPNGGSGVTFGKSHSSIMPHHEKLI